MVLAQEAGISNQFSIDGPPIAMNLATRDKSGCLSMGFRTLFSQEMLRNGVLMPWIAVSLSHGEVELQMTLEAARKTMQVYARALNDGLEKYLVGSAIKPVFRKYN